MTLRVAAVVCALALAACGSSTTILAGSDINGGTIPISQAATYHFSLTGSCKFQDAQFRMVSDSGKTDYLVPGPSSGQLYLSDGNWSSAYGFVGVESAWYSLAGNCPTWHLTLTATG
jgi:hypothetical protein